jgi:Tfp pilus assembly protein PilW
VTLTELLVTSGIVLSLAGAVASAAQGTQRLLAAQLDAADVDERTRVAVDALARDLRQARGLPDCDAMRDGLEASPSPSFTITGTAPEGTAFAHTWAVSPETLELTRYDGPGATFPIVDQVDAAAFACAGAPPNVGVHVSIVLASGSGAPPRTVDLDVAPRNAGGG